MNNKLIGQYIQLLRKQKKLSQKELANLLSVSFQAVSKWETGENLPDASILLDLADILGTTTDHILSGGSIVLRSNKRIDIAGLKEGILSLQKLKNLFGEKSMFYVGAMEGISSKLTFNIEDFLQNEEGREILLAEAIIQCLVNGYQIDSIEIERCIHSEQLRRKVKKYVFDCELFDNKAQAYLNYRPSYPAEIIDLIFSHNSTPVIADIGSGTGKFTQHLLPYAQTVYAVEPNKQMRKTAEDLLKNYQNYISVASSAENTTLPDYSVDIITVAEAYHWFDNEMAKNEFQRILKPGGYVFILWNEFGGDEYDEEMQQISNQYKRSFEKVNFSHEDRAINLFGLNKYEKIRVDNSIFQTCEEFCGGWSSASYIPERGTKEYKAFLEQAMELFEKYAENGMLKSTITTACFYGKLK